MQVGKECGKVRVHKSRLKASQEGAVTKRQLKYSTLLMALEFTHLFQIRTCSRVPV